MHRLCALPLLVLASCLVGCGPSWDVVRASGPPSALLDAEHFVVKTDYSGTLVLGEREDDYVMGIEDPEEQDHWVKAKKFMDDGFLEWATKYAPQVRFEAAPEADAKSEGAKSEGPEILVEYLTIQPGYYGFFREEAIVTARISFLVGGIVTDRITMECDINSTKWNPTVVDRLANIGRQFGHGAAAYLNEAQGR
jgi:hypothetical protein